MQKFKVQISLFLWWSLILICSNGLSQQWIKISSIDSTNVYQVIDHKGVLYAVTDDKIFSNTSGSTDWTALDNLPEVNSNYSTIFSDQASLFLSINNSGIYISPDNGQSWQPFSSGLSGYAKYVNCFTMLGDSIYAGTENGIYTINRTKQDKWTAINSGLYFYTIQSIAATDELLLTCANGGLYVRKRAGEKWTEVFPDSNYWQLKVNKIHVREPYIFLGTDNGIYRSDMSGRNWIKTDIDVFPGEEIIALTTHNSRLIAGLHYHGHHWLFSSDDMAEHWELRAHEFSFLFDLTVSENRLWAARSDGLWYQDIDFWTDLDDPFIEKPAAFALHPNYPNPFNPHTRIKFTLPQAGHVLLQIYNMQGSRISTLVNDYMNPGDHAVTFNGTELASGAYIYHLKSGAFEQSRKMLLVR